MSDLQAIVTEVVTKHPALATDRRILDRFAEDVRSSGLVGEEALAKLLLLAVVSRHFEEIVNVVVKGPSAAGKSYTVQQVLRFVPREAYIDLTSCSELGLVYMEDDLRHRIVVLFEAFALAEDSAAAYIVRSLLSEKRIKHQTTIKQKGVLIEKEGPTGLITTTTKVALHDENETRLISVTVDDTKAQTERVLKEQARRARGEQVNPPRVERWHELLTWIEQGPHEVVVLYAEAVAALIPPVAIRLRRDFPQILGLIRAHALLHRATRERDERGRIIASLGDYEAVREIVAPLVADAAEASVTDTLRQTVEAVERLLPGSPEGVTVAVLAKALDVDKSSASRRAARARDRGFLVNEEERPGRPARLKLGEPLPEDTGILPTTTDLEAELLPPRIERNGATVTEPSATPTDRATVKTPSDQREQPTVAPLHSRSEQRETFAQAHATVPQRATVAPTADALAVTVRRAVELAGGNRFVAARDLAEAGVPTPDGNAWTSVTIERIEREAAGA
jgi:hypothetical protein